MRVLGEGFLFGECGDVLVWYCDDVCVGDLVVWELVFGV